jgi:hypothetical protein
MFQNI